MALCRIKVGSATWQRVSLCRCQFGCPSKTLSRCDAAAAWNPTRRSTREDPHKIRSSLTIWLEFEISADRFDERLGLDFLSTKGCLQASTNSFPLFLVLRGEKRKKLSQVFVNSSGDRRPFFARERRGNPKHICAMLGDVFAFSFLSSRSPIRQV